MSKQPLSQEVNFVAPGPGTWKKDTVHYPHPVTRYFEELAPAPLGKGSNEFARFYGFIFDRFKLAFVNGFGYMQLMPVAESDLPARFERVKQVFEQKLWREDLREWDERCKPNSIAASRRLQSIQPDELSDVELISYLKTCQEHHAAMWGQHLRFTAGAVIPIGDLLIQAKGWSNLSSADILSLLKGSSDVSSGGSDEMENLKQAFANHAEAHQLLLSDGNPEDIVEKLSLWEGPLGTAFRAYLDLVGNRIMNGFDIDSPTTIEMPDALIRSLRAIVTEGSVSHLDVDTLTANVRAQIPAEFQSEFDELLQEARLMYRMRDERGIYGDIWAAGIMRRAALAAGRRVAKRGRIFEPQHILDATIKEMCDLVADTGGPSAEELKKRATFRSSHTISEAPAILGDATPEEPDLSALPKDEARIMRAFLTVFAEMFEGRTTTQQEENRLLGLSASKGIYEGPARLVSGPTEFNRIHKGDVLITESTTEAFNILLPLLGGIITDNGGLLSHAAIVSREYGIPGVVGTGDATKRIQDGARVRVDGDNGEITVIQ